MRYLFVLILLSGCASTKTEYRCPPGQVMILEDRGLTTEKTACYTPGVSYTDFRPLTTEVLK